MTEFDPSLLKKLYVPSSDSHKAQNGKVMLIGGSKLFHAASLWSLQIASRIVDMVFYCSTEENNEIVKQAKSEFRNGIVIPRRQIDSYIQEADVILIGPGMPRPEGKEEGDDDTKEITERLLKQYPYKKWVIDGGSLQTIEPEVLLGLKQIPVLTPHQGEFERLFGNVILSETKNLDPSAVPQEDKVSDMAKKFDCVINLKGEVDIVASPTQVVSVSGGNAGMTKGGTGDVLAGLTAALYSKNDAFDSACAASYINKKAGESLEQSVGLYYNASDLADEVPKVMKSLLL